MKWCNAVCMAIALIAIIFLSPGRRRKTDAALSGAAIADLQSGDIVFFAGNRWRSAAVKLLEPGPGIMTHLGIVIGKGDSASIVHASPYTNKCTIPHVRLEPLISYLEREDALAASVYRCISDSAASKAALWAYDKARKAFPFDNHFDLCSDSALYCTELIWKAFRSARIDLSNGAFDTISHLFGAREVIFPSRISQSRYLRRIYP